MGVVGARGPGIDGPIHYPELKALDLARLPNDRKEVLSATIGAFFQGREREGSKPGRSRGWRGRGPEWVGASELPRWSLNPPHAWLSSTARTRRPFGETEGHLVALASLSGKKRATSENLIPDKKTKRASSIPGSGFSFSFFLFNSSACCLEALSPPNYRLLVCEK